MFRAHVCTLLAPLNAQQVNEATWETLHPFIDAQLNKGETIPSDCLRKRVEASLLRLNLPVGIVFRARALNQA